MVETVIYPVDFKKNGHIIDDVRSSLYSPSNCAIDLFAPVGNA